MPNCIEIAKYLNEFQRRAWKPYQEFGKGAEAHFATIESPIAVQTKDDGWSAVKLSNSIGTPKIYHHRVGA